MPISSCKQIHVLGERRALLGDQCLGGVEDLLRLPQVGSRRDSAFEPGAGQRDAALGIGGRVLGDLEHAGVGGIGQPGIGDVGDQREARRSAGRFGREIAVEVGLGQRADAAEQVELETGNGKAGAIFDVCAALARSGCFRPGHGRASIDMRVQVGALDPILLASRGDIGGRGHQVAVVGKACSIRACSRGSRKMS